MSAKKHSMQIPSSKQFEQGKSSSNDIMKWRDLPKGVIYGVYRVEYIETKYGNSLVAYLIDNDNEFKVWVPGHIAIKLRDYGADGREAFIKPLDLKPKSSNPSQKFWDYEIMWSTTM